MKKILCLVAVILWLAAPAGADSLKGDSLACLSEDLYDQAVTAAVKKDMNAWRYLSKNGCMITKPSLSITILDLNLLSASKVRIYLGKQTLEVWTSFENIQRDQK